MSKLPFSSAITLMCDRNVPMILVDGAVDEPATVASILQTIGIREGTSPVKELIYTWDCVGGLEINGLTANFGEAERLLVTVKATKDKLDTRNSLLAIKAITDIADHLLDDTRGGNPQGLGTAVVFFTGDRFLSEKNEDYLSTVQLLMNSRDALGLARITLIFVGIDFNVPPELKEHVQRITAPLPVEDEIVHEIQQAYQSYEENFDANRGDEKFVLTDSLILSMREALRGVPLFQVRQILFLAMDNRGIHLDRLRENAIQTLNQQRGLSVQPSTGQGFSALGGLDSLKEYLLRLKNSPKFKVKTLLFVDEIEKATAGSQGTDTSGVSGNMLGSLLTEMQETRSYGLMLTGVYGCGKSALAKAFGEELDAITIHLDLSGMKDSLVGSSETNLRNALKTIRSIGGDDGGIMWIATCNRIEQLPPELKRRYNLGTYFFALPSKAERDAIWDIYLRKYELVSAGNERVYVDELRKNAGLNDEGWTGAEIETCCRLADLLNCGIEETATRITPVAVTARDEIQLLCKEADGRFLDATHKGVYRMNRIEPTRKTAGTDSSAKTKLIL